MSRQDLLQFLADYGYNPLIANTLNNKELLRMAILTIGIYSNIL